MIKTRVKLKRSFAKWYLDNPEIYKYSNGKVSMDYETDTLIHLICCLGEPVYGTIIEKGSHGCWLVKWKIGKFSTEYYASKRHFDII